MAGNLIHDLDAPQKRQDLHNKYMEKLGEISNFAEAELNAIVTDKKIEDELRGFKDVYDSTILNYENDKKSIMSLVDSVTKNFKISHDFFLIKAKMLGLKKLNYSDRAAKVGKVNRKISFEESFEILTKVFESTDPIFAKILKSFMQNGQIDVFPKVGKTSGAYCSSYYGLPTFVLLNHTDSFKSLSTFAHEMGHAMHSEYSKNNSPLYVDYSMSTAEVASTLFESFLFYSEFEKMTDEEKIVALHDKISDDVQTIFRQIACFNFETEMHKTIREKGGMTKEELGAMMNKHMKSYLGPAFDLTELDGNFFVTWSHLRNFFYVYSYGFGQLASKAIYKKYSEDRGYIDKIIKFLSVGGSMSPEDTFKSIGVDVKKPDFWLEGIKSIAEDIARLNKLISK
jgi:oligoendopeptidase F